jgi:predicted DNA-binding antitoxin AbrB/MazE fold protein
MGITVEAIYESGVLKPLKPLDTLQEHERVRITVQPVGVVAEQRGERVTLPKTGPLKTRGFRASMTPGGLNAEEQI